MMRHSIRVRLTAWYALLTLVALIVMAAAVLALVRHSVTRAADDRLAAHHSGLERFANALEAGLTPAEVHDSIHDDLGWAIVRLIEQRHRSPLKGDTVNSKQPVIRARRIPTRLSAPAWRRWSCGRRSRWAATSPAR